MQLQELIPKRDHLRLAFLRRPSSLSQPQSMSSDISSGCPEPPLPPPTASAPADRGMEAAVEAAGRFQNPEASAQETQDLGHFQGLLRCCPPLQGLPRPSWLPLKVQRTHSLTGQHWRRSPGLQGDYQRVGRLGLDQNEIIKIAKTVWDELDDVLAGHPGSHHPTFSWEHPC